MFDGLKRWSESQGQWHYVFGYLIVLVSHNWPIMLSLALVIAQSVRVYRRPNRADVCLLYGYALLGAAYEYHKHLAGVLDEAIDFLLGMELLPLNAPAHEIAGPLATVLLFGAALVFLAQGLRLRHKNRTQIDADAPQIAADKG